MLAGSDPSLYRFRVIHPRHERKDVERVLPYHRASLYYSKLNPQVGEEFRGKMVLDAVDNGNGVRFKWGSAEGGREIYLNYLELFEIKVLLDQYWKGTDSTQAHVLTLKNKKLKPAPEEEE